MEGLEAVQGILNVDDTARIVMVSSNGNQGMVKEALAHGAKHFLTKPVEPSRVKDVVGFVLEDR